MTKREQAAAALARMVDELGDLEGEIAPFKAKFARVEVLRSAIRSAYAKADPGRMYQASGERWVCLIGKAGNQSVVDKAELLKRVGPSKFADAANVSIKALEEHFPKEILGAVVSLEPTGPRIITVVPANEAQL
jgi:hypothetical protein